MSYSHQVFHIVFYVLLEKKLLNLEYFVFYIFEYQNVEDIGDHFGSCLL